MNRQMRGQQLEATRNANLVEMFGPTALEDTKPPPLYTRQRRAAVKIGRNDPCLCGSGKKFKKCCLNKEI